MSPSSSPSSAVGDSRKPWEDSWRKQLGGKRKTRQGDGAAKEEEDDDETNDSSNETNDEDLKTDKTMPA